MVAVKLSRISAGPQGPAESLLACQVVVSVAEQIGQALTVDLGQLPVAWPRVDPAS
jgi:hypothetical protein